MDIDKKCIRKVLQCVTELVLGVCDERIKGVAQPALSDKFEGCAAHPFQHVNFATGVLDFRSYSIAQLCEVSRRSRVTRTNNMTNAVDCVIEDRCDVSHMGDREDGGQHLALSTVRFTYNRLMYMIVYGEMCLPSVANSARPNNNWFHLGH